MNSIQAFQLVAERQFVKAIPSKTSVLEAIRWMQDLGVDGIPVVRSDPGPAEFTPVEWHNDFVLTAQGEFGPFIGVLEAQDIACFAAFYPAKPGAETLEQTLASTLVQDLVGYYERLMNTNSMNGLFVVSPKCSIPQLTELFAGGVKRVFVSSFSANDRDKDFSLKEITPQFLFNYFWKHDSAKELSQTLGDKNFTDETFHHLLSTDRDKFDHLEVINSDATIRDALQKLMMSRSDVLAVVDSKGALVRDFSAKDLLPMFASNEGIQATLDSSIEKYYGGSSAKLTKVHYNDYLIPTFRKLDPSGVDRVWIIDPKKKPAFSCVGMDSIDRLISI